MLIESGGGKARSYLTLFSAQGFVERQLSNESFVLSRFNIICISTDLSEIVISKDNRVINPLRVAVNCNHSPGKSVGIDEKTREIVSVIDR